MNAILLLLAVVLALTAGWALLQAAEKSRRGPPLPEGGDLMVLEHSPVGALLLDPGLRVTWANDTFCRFFGLSRAEVVGWRMPALIQSHLKGAVEEPAAFESGLLTAYAQNTATALEIHVRPEGTRLHRWLEHMSHVIRQGPLEGSRIEYFVNVTPLKHVALEQEAGVRRRMELNRTLVDLASRPTRSAPDPERAVREVSEAASATLGVVRVELWVLSPSRELWTLDHYYDSSARRHKTSSHEVKSADIRDYGSVIEKVRALAVADVKKDPRGRGMVGQGLLQPSGGARLDAAVRVAGRVAGTVVCIHTGPRTWTAEEEQFAASIADRLSLIFEMERTEGADSPSATSPTAILEADPLDGFVHLDQDLRFTYLNSTVLQWLAQRGHDGKALVGRGLAQSLVNVEDTSVVAEIRKAARGGGPARLRRQLEPGGPWLDVYINPVENGVTVTLQNKERRKEREAERSLQESETRFRSVVESLGEGLIITDLQDRIVYVNPRIAELTGRRPEDLGGRGAQDLLFDTKVWKTAGVRLSARKERKRVQFEAPLLHKDGHVIEVEVISSPLRNAAGEVTGVVDAVTDVSQRPKPGS